MAADRARRAEERAAALARASRTLAELVGRDRNLTELLASDQMPDRRAHAEALAAALAEGEGAFRAEKRRRLADIAARDLAAELSLEAATAALADLADACLQVGLDRVGSDGMAVIGMGKLGGRELNYCSDIDVVFVCEDDVERATKAAHALLALLTAFGPEGQAYRVDTNLRPEGAAGPLVRSVDSYLEYLARWAEPWELQALIKARFCAGDAAAAARLLQGAEPSVYATEVTPERVAAIRKMKERVESHALKRTRRGGSEHDDVKLGPGGIRDIEFSVQLLQLVHGGSDPSVRQPGTLAAIGALVDGGYLAEDDGAGLVVAYHWLRTVEHRLQLWQERQVHTLPSDPEDRARLARTLGFKDTPVRSALSGFEQRHRAVLADVRGRFEKLFYRPMIEALADGDGPRLSPGAVRDRLAILGFRDVERAARTLDGLVSGTSRRAKLFRVLTPAMLRFLAGAPLPDEGLFAFLRLGEKLGDRLDVIGALRDNPPAIALLSKVLGSGRVLGEMLEHAPDELGLIVESAAARPGGRLKDSARLAREAQASLTWRAPEQRLDGLRRFKRRELLRIALADLSGEADVAAVGRALAHLGEACLAAALGEPGLPFAVIGLGRLGGYELNYPSDLDLMFVADGDVSEAERLAEHLLHALGEVTPEGQVFKVDASLRPEGRAGPLARSFEACLEYYSRWARPWEHLALIKARPVAGDLDLGGRFVAATRPFAFPAQPPAAALAEIRHLKARMEKERIPRGTDPRRHLKLGPGGISDIEFAVQILQHSHAHRAEGLRVTNTLAALDAARLEGLIADREARWLADGYTFLSRLRNRLYLMAGRGVDVLPVKPERLEALGIAMGFTDQPRQELEEAYLRVTRRVRRVAEPIIYVR
jgi:glutamate-ammonia-ligase adenylyltransferase